MEAQNESESGKASNIRISSQNEPSSSTGKTPVISGSCACAAVQWTSTQAPSRGSFCYCTTCRKLSGGAFLAFMDLPVSSVNFLPPLHSPYSPLKAMSLSKNAERGFCKACGSTLTMRYWATPETIYLTIASVDEGSEMLKGLKKKHLYVCEKVEWYTLPDDGLPRFETMPNESKYLAFGD